MKFLDEILFVFSPWPWFIWSALDGLSAAITQETTPSAPFEHAHPVAPAHQRAGESGTSASSPARPSKTSLGVGAVRLAFGSRRTRRPMDAA